MSGIAAIYNSSGEPLPFDSLTRLLGVIAHRGPRVACWQEPGIALGQRSLATTPEAEDEDLPLVSAGGRFQLALDGRLDNRRDLLDRLRPASRRITDPELIALALEKWGNDAAGQLVGDFAFVAWDRQSRRLLAVRDQRGFRPLVYTRVGRRFICGSEAQQILSYPEVPPTVDALFLACHLSGAQPPQGSSPYASVCEVPPGHCLVVQAGTATLRSYWRFEPGPPLRYRRREDYVDHLESVFREAVTAACRTNSPPAVLLSGGLDSSYVTSHAAEAAGDVRAVHGFAMSGAGMDERAFAGAVAEHLDVPLSLVDVGDCWSLSSRYLSAASFDQPNVPMQAPVMIKLAREARQAGSQVLLDGVGGDEFLSGGNNYICGLVMSGRPAQALQECGAWSAATGMPASKLLFRTGLAPLVPAGLRRRIRHWRGRPAPNDCPPWLDSGVLQALRLGSAIPSRLDPPAWDRGAEYAAFWANHERESLPVFAWRERRASLPAGVEARSPFWDLRVIELVSRMPGWVHRSAGRPKALLRAAMKRRLPSAVVERDDKGNFDCLLQSGVLEHEAGRLQSSLCGPLERLFYVRGDVLQSEVETYRRLRHRWWHGLWRAVTAGLWLQQEEARLQELRASLLALSFGGSPEGARAWSARLNGAGEEVQGPGAIRR